MSQETKEFYLFSIIMSLIMSGGMSLAMAIFTLDLAEAFASWPVGWLVSFIVALPMSFVVVPFTKNMVTLVLVEIENK